MSKSNSALAEPRAARNRARAEFMRELGQAKVELAPAVLKRRVVGEAQRKAMSVTNQAIEIASDSRGIIAASVTALVLWLARKPIFNGANALLTRYQERKTVTGQTKLLIADYWRKLKEYADD